MPLNKITISIQCIDTKESALLRHIKNEVIPAIKAGKTSGNFYIKEQRGSWKSFYRRLKKTPLSTVSTYRSKVVSDEMKLEFIKDHIEDFITLNAFLSMEGFDGKNELIRKIGRLSREHMKYSKTTATQDIINTMHKMYINHFT